MKLETVRRELVETLNKKDMSQSELADLIHTTKSNISNYLNPHRNIPNTALIAIAEALDDVRFRLVAATYVFKFPFVSEDEFKNDPQSRMTVVNDVESKRRQLNNTIAFLMSKKHLTLEEQAQAFSFVKQYTAEIAYELSSIASMTDALGVSEKNEELEENIYDSCSIKARLK